jgi:NAD-dependent deacetylase
MDVLPPRGDFTRIVALTGAGISVAAGLGTFRGPDGLWMLAPDVEQAMDAAYLPGNVGLMWRVWGGMWTRAQEAGPTPAHAALAAAGVRVITQNVDGLHHRAGSGDVIEVHGSAGRARCLECAWAGPAAETAAADDTAAAADGDPRRSGAGPAAEDRRCPQCGAPARPDVVLFGEMLDQAVLRAAQVAAASCDLFLAIGTSGRVAPASWLAPLARQYGATVVNIDPDPAADPGPAFQLRVAGDAQDLLPGWAGP